MNARPNALPSLIELTPQAMESIPAIQDAQLSEYMAEIHHLTISTHPFPGVRLEERLPQGREQDFDYACRRARLLAEENGVGASVTVNGLEVHTFMPDGRSLFEPFGARTSLAAVS